MELTKKQQDRINRLAKIADDGELGIVEELNDLEDKIDNLPLPEKGDKGDKGDPGEPGRDGVDGKDGKDGRDGLDGKDGEAGQDGAPGKDGQDGSPDTPIQIVEKLESLEGEERLDAKAIKNLSEQTRAIGAKAGWGAHPLMIQDDGTTIDKVARTLNFTGGTVTRTASGVINVPIGATIGDPVIGGTANELLFTDGSGNLAQSANLKWGEIANTLCVTGQMKSFCDPIAVSSMTIEPVSGLYGTNYSSGILNFDATVQYSFLVVSTEVLATEDIVAVNLFADTQRVKNVAGSNMTGLSAYVSFYANPRMTMDVDLINISYLFAHTAGWVLDTTNGGTITVQGMVDFYSGFNEALSSADITISQRFHFLALDSGGLATINAEYGFYNTCSDYAFMSLDGKNVFAITTDNTLMEWQTLAANTAYILDVHDESGNTFLILDATGRLGIKTTPTSTLDVAGSVANSSLNMATDLTLDDTHHSVDVVCDSVDITITLPSAAACPGREYEISKVDATAFNVIVVPDGADTIIGETSIIISNQWDSMKVRSDGVTKWDIR